MKKDDYVKKSGDEFILHEFNEVRDDTTTIFQEIRGAVIRPSIPLQLPGYYLILGKKKDKNHCVFLAERQNMMQNQLFEVLKADAERFLCHLIYTDLLPGKKAWEDHFFMDLHYYLQSLGWGWLVLHPEYSQGNIESAAKLVYEYTNDIPEETQLRHQLRQINPENFDSPQLYAARALYFLLIGFKKNENPSSLTMFDKSREEAEKARKKELRKSLDNVSRAAWDELDKEQEQLELENEYNDSMGWNYF